LIRCSRDPAGRGGKKEGGENETAAGKGKRRKEPGCKRAQGKGGKNLRPRERGKEKGKKKKKRKREELFLCEASKDGPRKGSQKDDNDDSRGGEG